MDDWSAHGPGLRIDRRATDWGLASLWVGGFFLVMGPVQLLFNDYYWCVGRHHADRHEIALARIVGPGMGIAFLGVIGFGLFAGFRGLRLARTTDQPLAFPIAGILICGLDVLMWIGLTANLMGILGMIR
ncbi:MAG TPA: hypothetical protein VM597_22325 [Gemmataceae bacterium]|nr:hypothetical protein [Gemmataceae bacterium]